MLNLDDLSTYAKIDPADMREHIQELPQQCADAWEQARNLDLPASHRSPRTVVVLGMGGSAIGGALTAGLVADECPTPIQVVGGYDLPAHVDRDTLVIASSHSGNTEETLALTAQAEAQGAPILAITTDGELSTLAREKGWPVIRFDYHSQPRAALGYSFTLLLGALWRLGVVRDYGDDLWEAIDVMRAWQRQLVPQVSTDDNPAKRLAWQLIDRLPVVYGAAFLAPVARRWKGQLNENAKNWAFWEELPELNHNAVVGYQLPPAIRERTAVICLRSPLDHPRIKARWEATIDLLKEQDVMAEVIWGRGRSRLAQLLSLIHVGDYVSYYLSLLNGVDPTPVRAIDHLKRQLAQT
jgi:glucose/mannose-6-phosphate isomerase